jgi:hypothetical protein
MALVEARLPEVAGIRVRSQSDGVVERCDGLGDIALFRQTLGASDLLRRVAASGRNAAM